jgi:class 3 adenylate cyclase
MVEVNEHLAARDSAAVGSNVNLAGRVESFTTGGQVLSPRTPACVWRHR